MAAETIVYTPENNNGGMNNMIPWLANLSQNSGINYETLLLMMMGGGGMGFGGFGGGGIWLLFLWMMWQNGGFGGNGGNLANMINNDSGRELLMQAINGNRTAISELSTNLNCSIGQIQTVLNTLGTQIQSVGSKVDMSGMQVINAIQAGDNNLMAQLASCCCDIKQAIATQGYESRIATLQQTEALSSKIDAQTNMINDKFCQLEMRELQNKLDASRLENTQLRGEISQQNQNAYLTGVVGQAVAPLNAQLAVLGKEVDAIKCKMPETTNVPYSPVVGVPSCVAAQYGLFGGLGTFGFGNGFFG